MKKSQKFSGSLILLLLSFNLFGQNNDYFKNQKGVIVDKATYSKEKAAYLEKIQIATGNKKIQIAEDLNLLYKRNDSAVYSHNWIVCENPKLYFEEVKRKKALLEKEYPIKNEKTIDGKTINIDDFKGKPTLINLWFTGCAVCIEEMPVLNKLKEKYGDKYNFVSITFDSKKKVEKLLQKHPFNFEHITGSNKLTRDMGFQGYPVNLFLDKNGVVKYIEGNIPITTVNGKLVMSDGKEFIQLLEKLQ